MVETSCNSFSVNSSGPSNPIRTEPYIKTTRGWTILTFNNGQQVHFTETVSTGMIMVDLDCDGRHLVNYTADQFAVFVLEVKSR